MATDSERLDALLQKLDSLEKRMDALDDKTAEAKATLKALHLPSDSDKKSRESITRNVLKNFNFKRCSDVMKFTNWTWASIPSRTPNANEIKDTAADLFARVWNSLDKHAFDKYGWRELVLETGGLAVWAFEGDETHDFKRGAKLMFIVEEFAWDDD